MVLHGQASPDYLGIALGLQPQENSAAAIAGRQEQAPVRVDRRGRVNIKIGFPVVAPEQLAVGRRDADAALTREVNNLTHALYLNRDRRRPADAIIESLPDDAAIFFVERGDGVAPAPTRLHEKPITDDERRIAIAK